jgi:signal transduction histidine kinase
MFNGKTFSGVFFRSFDPENTVKVVLACWVAVLLIFAVLPMYSSGRMLAAAGAYWVAEAFTGVALVLALLKSSGSGRLFWALLVGAVLLRYASDLVWTGSGVFGVEIVPAHQLAADALSYTLFFVSLLWLARRSRQEMTPVAALDIMGTMLSTGLLLWYFVLGPDISPTDLDAWEDFVDLAQPVCDLGLFLLVLGILLKIRSPFVAFLTGSLLLFLITDGSYLALRANGPYVVGGCWPVLLWTGGVALLGTAALHRGSADPLGQAGEPRFGNLETFLFWLGPLSPPLQYGALLVWGTFYPPLPGYVLLCGAFLLAILALRTYAANHVGGLLTDRREAASREQERCRILGELHDTVKQSVRGTSMMIEACKEAHQKEDPAKVRDLLNQTLQMSREARRQLSKPLDELRLFCQEAALSPTAFLKERFEKFGKDDGLTAHEDLQAPLEVLDLHEIIVAFRVCIEASCNAANHANARYLWLESRQIGSVLVLKVHDDGCGFVPEEVTEGLGLRLMRSRAEEVGAGLDVISAPGRGTTVQLRFDKK